MIEMTAMTGGDDPERSIDLLLKARAGDEDARNDLFGRYLPRLERWASRRLPLSVRTMLDTGDIVQEAMVSALRHIDTLEIRSDNALEVYLKQTIRNRIIDAYRRPRREREDIKADLPARGPSAFDMVAERETRERYEDALESLNDQDCQIIVMHSELGMTAREIGEELGRNTDAARMALGRALKKLAVAMQERMA